MKTLEGKIKYDDRRHYYRLRRWIKLKQTWKKKLFWDSSSFKVNWLLLWLFVYTWLFVCSFSRLFVNASSDGMSEVMGNVVCLSHQHKKKHESQKRNFSKGAEILNQIILTNFQVFGNVVKHSVSLLINDVKHRASKQDTTISKTALTFKTWENNWSTTVSAILDPASLHIITIYIDTINIITSLTSYPLGVLIQLSCSQVRTGNSTGWKSTPRYMRY